MVKTILFTKEDCIETESLYSMNFEGRIMILKPEALNEKYRNAKYQLVKCMGGFGCDPTKLGQAIFVQELYHGDDAEYYRRERYNHDFMGIASDEAINEFKKLYGWRE